MEKRIIPVFKTEAEEAQWWFDHREELGEDALRAVERGDTGEGTMARVARLKAVKELVRSAA